MPAVIGIGTEVTARSTPRLSALGSRLSALGSRLSAVRSCCVGVSLADHAALLPSLRSGQALLAQSLALLSLTPAVLTGLRWSVPAAPPISDGPRWETPTHAAYSRSALRAPTEESEREEDRAGDRARDGDRVPDFVRAPVAITSRNRSCPAARARGSRSGPSEAGGDAIADRRKPASSAGASRTERSEGERDEQHSVVRQGAPSSSQPRL